MAAAVIRADEIDRQNPIYGIFACRGYDHDVRERVDPGPESFAANVYASALTYCTTMMTCPSGLSVTVYQMVKPSEGR